MFGIFKRKSRIEKLQDEHRKLLEQAFKKSHTDRSASDSMIAEADRIAKKIDSLKEENNDNR